MADDLLNDDMLLGMGMDDEEEDFVPEPNLQALAEQRDLRWIFVGGKGGVGKTTTSCSLGVMLSKVRDNVLIISTDPAHNLSDAFSQKFGSEPKAVDGIPNLFCMEVDPAKHKQQFEQQMDMGAMPAELAAQLPEGAEGAAGEIQSLLKDLTGSIPGVDELMSFAELMKSVNNMKYSCIVFDTAPTGHTLRLLSFPNTLESALGKILGLKSKFGGMFAGLAGLMGGQAAQMEGMMAKLEGMVEICLLYTSPSPRDRG